MSGKNRLLIAESLSGDFKIRVTAVNETVALLSAKKRKKIFFDAMRRIGEGFVRNFLPLRFTRHVFGNGFPYKGKGGKNGIPLVESGETKQEVSATTTITPQGTSKGARVKIVFSVPEHIDLNRKNNLRATLDHVTPAEAQEMREAYVGIIEEAFFGATARKTKTGRVRLKLGEA